MLPLYHRPIATVVMIVLSVVSFFAFPCGHHEAWMLAIGAGIHPLQWVSNMFMHGNLMHLIGNMIFLWAFGIIVEGKLGWWAFTFVYLGIGVAESAGIQLATASQTPEHMLGASGAIYGLLAICLVWAPKNEMHCLAFFRFFPTDFDLSILWFAAFYIGMQRLEFAVRGPSQSQAPWRASRRCRPRLRRRRRPPQVESASIARIGTFSP